MENPVPAWTPSPERIKNAKVTAFINWLASERGIQLADYDALWRWSVTDIDAFWVPCGTTSPSPRPRRAARLWPTPACPAPCGSPASN